MILMREIKEHKKRLAKFFSSFAMILFVLTGCGGGGGSHEPHSAAPTRAVVKLSTAGSPSTTLLVGVQATVHLPVGVTVQATTNAPQTDRNVIVASGNAVPADLVFGVYSAASGTVSAYVLKGTGFAVGEFATVNCDVITGATIQALDFSVSDLVVSDANGNLMTGLVPGITVFFE
jgi:hypothetical protein